MSLTESRVSFVMSVCSPDRRGGWGGFLRETTRLQRVQRALPGERSKGPKPRSRTFFRCRSKEGLKSRKKTGTFCNKKKLIFSGFMIGFFHMYFIGTF